MYVGTTYYLIFEGSNNSVLTLTVRDIIEGPDFFSALVDASALGLAPKTNQPILVWTLLADSVVPSAKTHNFKKKSMNNTFVKEINFTNPLYKVCDVKNVDIGIAVDHLKAEALANIFCPPLHRGPASLIPSRLSYHHRLYQAGLA